MSGRKGGLKISRLSEQGERTVTQLLRWLSAALVGCALVVAIPTPMRPDFDGRSLYYSAKGLRSAIHWYSKQYRLDPALLHAVIKAESGFDMEAVSRKGAVGLMQLMPPTAASLQVADPFDPLQNIRAGAKQLRHLLNRYHGNVPLALAAYNAGVHQVQDHQVPRIPETRAYVGKVLRYYRDFKPRQQHHKAKPPGTHYRPAPPKRPSPPTASPPPKKGYDPRADPFTDRPQTSNSF